MRNSNDNHKPTQAYTSIHNTSLHHQEQKMTVFIYMLDRALELTSQITKGQSNSINTIAVINGYNTIYE